MDLVTIRTALLISLSILLVVVLFIRFRRRTVARELPVASHAELLHVEVAYHPARLHVHVRVPVEQELRTSLLGADHILLHAWDSERTGPGTIELERRLPPLADGLYHVELATRTQRTVRRFRLQQA